jgi:hypothetical protein
MHSQDVGETLRLIGERLGRSPFRSENVVRNWLDAPSYDADFGFNRTPRQALDDGDVDAVLSLLRRGGGQ